MITTQIPIVAQAKDVTGATVPLEYAPLHVYRTAHVQVNGASNTVATVAVQCSIDGTTWVGVTTAVYVVADTVAVGIFPLFGKYVRFVLDWTSGGAVTVTAVLDSDEAAATSFSETPVLALAAP